MNLADLARPMPAPAQPPTAPQPSPPPGPPAPAPVVGGPVEPDGSDLWRQEQITGRELATLAGKLLRQTSDEKQSLGRALLRAIKGEPFAQQGARNLTAFKLSGEIVSEYPNCDPETVIACVSASISRVQAEGSKMTEAKWLGMIERLQDERRARVNMVKDLGGRLGKALQAQAAQVTRALPEGALWAAQGAAEPRATVATAPGSELALNTLLIKADGRYYLRRPSESIYRWVLDSHESLAIELAHQFGTGNTEVMTHDATGQPLPIGDLVRVYASNAHRIVHDYASPRTTWNPAEQTLYVGLPDALPPPKLDADVHKWLAALAGPNSVATPEPGDLDRAERPVRDLYDWIAASSREYIDRPAAGLVIVGPKDTGKSLFALALAATWGVLPVKMANAVERFNGALLGSPFWWADERVPDDLTDAAYREIVQARSRLIEPKGREKVELRGCARLLITLNEPEDMRLGGLEGPNALEAVVDRIAYFDHSTLPDEPNPASLALNALRFGSGPRAHDVDLARVVGHLRAIQCGYTPRTQRFLGARADKSEARKFVIQQGIAKQNTELIDALIDYLSDVEKWERTYHPEERQFASGARYPVMTQDSLLWVWTRELADRLAAGNPGGRKYYWPAIKKACKTLRCGPPREHSFGSRTLRAEYIPIDLDKLFIAANVTPSHPLWQRAIGVVTVDTRVRKGLTD